MAFTEHHLAQLAEIQAQRERTAVRRQEIALIRQQIAALRASQLNQVLELASAEANEEAAGSENLGTKEETTSPKEEVQKGIVPVVVADLVEGQASASEKVEEVLLIVGKEAPSTSSGLRKRAIYHQPA
ncbi:hypothetical protein HK097_002883 [Rhizophlyctis rosea]|uniref:Uncharacterized protein n=1 Tax=Rhizophlyctis rosea TaxID=64517 RepID=A0AAD5SG85_9FUNG|nr:hypothetical protein HK097_002883 [Rhizophlyctis rosea]